MKETMTNHRITSQPWQLKAAAEGTLGAIILPYPKELLKREGQWDYHEWIRDEPTTCPYAQGDRIYLAEEWDEGFGSFGENFGFLLRSRTPSWADDDKWQPAETMPPEAAQYCFEITGVREVQMMNLTGVDTIAAGMPVFPATSGGAYASLDELYLNWNATYPSCLWDSDRWVIVLEVQNLRQ
jgi:hypothetical protein